MFRVKPSLFKPWLSRNIGETRGYVPLSSSSYQRVQRRERTNERTYNAQYTLPNIKSDPAVIEKFKSESGITIKGAKCNTIISSFDELDFPTPLVAALKESGIETPTPIQRISLPVALSGQDLVGVAQTGSGKTLSFVLPAMMHVMNRVFADKLAGQAPITLVLAPTRELAEQLRVETKKFAQALGCYAVALYGGASRYQQIESLLIKPHILIATPGRLTDLIEAGEATVKNVSYLVLDEADRMLDMGFEPQIRSIIEGISSERQTLMWSATWPKEVRYLADDFLNSPAFLQVGGSSLKANSNIKQVIERVDHNEKMQKLTQWIDKIKEEDGKALIFTDTKRFCLIIERHLANLGYKVVAMNGDMDQRSRDWSLQTFRRNEAKFMIATDVAARGLDVKDITHVINFDMPKNAESYIHRIGRTARGEALGTSVTFFSELDVGMSNVLVGVLKETGQEVPDFLAQSWEPSQRRRNNY